MCLTKSEEVDRNEGKFRWMIQIPLLLLSYSIIGSHFGLYLSWMLWEIGNYKRSNNEKDVGGEKRDLNELPAEAHTWKPQILTEKWVGLPFHCQVDSATRSVTEWTYPCKQRLRFVFHSVKTY